jgi:hypothetical protein
MLLVVGNQKTPFSRGRPAFQGYPGHFEYSPDEEQHHAQPHFRRKKDQYAA